MMKILTTIILTNCFPKHNHKDSNHASVATRVHCKGEKNEIHYSSMFDTFSMNILRFFRHVHKNVFC